MWFVDHEKMASILDSWGTCRRRCFVRICQNLVWSLKQKTGRRNWRIDTILNLNTSWNLQWYKPVWPWALLGLRWKSSKEKKKMMRIFESEWKIWILNTTLMSEWTWNKKWYQNLLNRWRQNEMTWCSCNYAAEICRKSGICRMNIRSSHILEIQFKFSNCTTVDFFFLRDMVYPTQSSLNRPLFFRSIQLGPKSI